MSVVLSIVVVILSAFFAVSKSETSMQQYCLEMTKITNEIPEKCS